MTCLSANSGTTRSTGEPLTTASTATRRSASAPGADRLDGGDGNDFLNGGDGAGDQVNGGAGDDTVSGGGHRDGEALVGDGPDQIDGGPGTDVLDYGDRSRGVEVDLRRAAPQGEPGENDSAIGVERTRGGAGENTLIGLDGNGAAATPSTGEPEPAAWRRPEPGRTAAAHSPADQAEAAPTEQDAEAQQERHDRAARERLCHGQGDHRSHTRKGHLRKEVSHRQTGNINGAPQAVGGNTRSLRKHARFSMKLSLGTITANVVIRRA